MPYEDVVIKKYIELIKSKTNVFKKFYIGDPIRVPISNLPACIISRNETRVAAENNAQDEHGMQMTLTVVTDIRKDISDDSSFAQGTASLYNIIEGRDETTLKLKEESILNILRNNLLVDASSNLRTDLGTLTRVDYGMTIDKRQVDFYALEAQVEFVAHFIQVR